MVFHVRQLLAFISSVDDPPAGRRDHDRHTRRRGPLISGDTVRVTIEGIGTLQNPVALPV